MSSNAEALPSTDRVAVAIIGGGIAGLAAALALKRSGCAGRIVVFESDPSRECVLKNEQAGYGLTLTYSANGPLAQLGLLEQCIVADCPSLFHFTFHSSGKVLGYYGKHFSVPTASATGAAGAAVIPTTNFTRGNLRIPRRQLRLLLLEALESDNNSKNAEAVVDTAGVNNDGNSVSVSWGKKLTCIEEIADWGNKLASTADSCSVSEIGGSSTESDDPGCVWLSFEDGTRVRADVVVGADGIRSLVRRHRDAALQQALSGGIGSGPVTVTRQLPPEQRRDSGAFGLQYLGVTAIIGISSYCGDWTAGATGSADTGPGLSSGASAGVGADLVTDGGFYVVDGTSRLFVMPYQRRDCTRRLQQLTMWQLSFSDYATEEEGLALKYGSTGSRASSSTSVPPKSLRELQQSYLREARRRCEANGSASNIPVVKSLLEHTAAEDTWCILLYDRPQHLQLWPAKMNVSTGIAAAHPAAGSRSRTGSVAVLGGSRVTVLGDAAHCMSMFKGQGANQCLQDAPLLAKWLASPSDGRARAGTRRNSDSSVLTRLRCFEREMTMRTSPHVEASRAAARHVHSPDILCFNPDIYGIPGVLPCDSPTDTNHKNSHSVSSGNSSSKRKRSECGATFNASAASKETAAGCMDCARETVFGHLHCGVSAGTAAENGPCCCAATPVCSHGPNYKPLSPQQLRHVQLLAGMYRHLHCGQPLIPTSCCGVTSSANGSVAGKSMVQGLCNGIRRAAAKAMESEMQQCGSGSV